MAKVIKEIIIMLLICLLTMLILAIALYKYIPNRKTVPEIVKYNASEEVSDLLEDDIDSRSDTTDVILTYDVKASDLSGYQSKNTYVPGKSNPFAAISNSTTSGDNSSTDSNSNTGSSEKTGNESSGSSVTNQTNPNQSTNSIAPSIYNNSGTK